MSVIQDPYRKLVSNHLAPFIDDQERAKRVVATRSEQEIFLAKCRSRLGDSEELNEQRLLETYIGYAFRGFHRMYALESTTFAVEFQKRVCRGLSQEAQNTHCAAVAQAVHEAVQHDFQGAQIALPNRSELQKEAHKELQILYLEERRCTAHLLLHSRMGSAIRECVRRAAMPSFDAVVLAVYHQAVTRFPVDSSVEEENLANHLQELIRPRIECLRVMLQCRQVLQTAIARLYVECREGTVVPSDEALVQQCAELLQNLQEEDRVECKAALQEHLGIELRQLRLELNDDLLRRSRVRRIQPSGGPSLCDIEREISPSARAESFDMDDLIQESMTYEERAAFL